MKIIKRNTFILLSIALLFFCEAANVGKKNRHRSGGRNLNVDSFWRGLGFILLLICGVFLLPVLFFLYNAAKDPLTPTLLVDAWKTIKEKTLGNLSKPKPKAN